MKVTPPASTRLQPVAVKVFGDKTELLIDREQELKVLVHLNKSGFGAQVREGAPLRGRAQQHGLWGPGYWVQNALWA